MFTIICITLFAYTLLGKPTRHLVARLRDIDWSEKWDNLMAKIRVYADKAGRVQDTVDEWFGVEYEVIEA